MDSIEDYAFEEEAITYEEALGASERFVAFRTSEGIAFRMSIDETHQGKLITKDEVLHFLDRQLEGGFQIQVA